MDLHLQEVKKENIFKRGGTYILCKSEQKRAEIIASSFLVPTFEYGSGFLYAQRKDTRVNIENIVSLAKKYNRENDVHIFIITDFLKREQVEETIENLIQNNKIVLFCAMNDDSSDILNSVVKNHLSQVLENKIRNTSGVPYIFIYNDVKISDCIERVHRAIKDVYFIQAGDKEQTSPNPMLNEFRA